MFIREQTIQDISELQPMIAWDSLLDLTMGEYGRVVEWNSDIPSLWDIGA